jgi:hypothetical protein
MSTPGLPLPTDAELSADATRILGKLPPLNVFRAVAGIPAALRPFLQLGGALLAGKRRPGMAERLKRCSENIHAGLWKVRRALALRSGWIDVHG